MKERRKRRVEEEVLGREKSWINAVKLLAARRRGAAGGATEKEEEVGNISRAGTSRRICCNISDCGHCQEEKEIRWSSSRR